MEQIEMLAAGGKDGGTLLEGRNEKCLTVLQREIAAGKKRSASTTARRTWPHMEKRLVEDLGFHKVGHEWLVAWDCTKRPDVKYDRALVLLRQRCKEELGRARARGARLPSRGAFRKCRGRQRAAISPRRRRTVLRGMPARSRIRGGTTT
jgi:hypothetical protein